MKENRTSEGVTRRAMLGGTVAGGALLAAACAGGGPNAAPRRAEPVPRASGGPFALPLLPWAPDALAPHISRRTIGFHYGKHHLGYVNKINKFVKGTSWEGKSLEEIVKGTAGKAGQESLFNNAAQVLNHTLYWHSMKPGGGGAPGAKLAAKLTSDFGSVDTFKTALEAAASTQFGSGWAWLVRDGAKLAVMKTSNGDTPLAHGKEPLLTIDVWEHAYYLDWQNRRPDYIKAWLDHLVNWSFAEQKLG